MARNALCKQIGVCENNEHSFDCGWETGYDEGYNDRYNKGVNDV